MTTKTKKNNEQNNGAKRKKTPLRIVLVRILAIFLAVMMIAIFGYYLVPNLEAVLTSFPMI